MRIKYTCDAYMSDENIDIIYQDGWNGAKRTEIIYYNIFFTFGCIPLILIFNKGGCGFWVKTLSFIFSLLFFLRGFVALITYILSMGKSFEIRDDYLLIPGQIGKGGSSDGKIHYSDIKEVVDFNNIIKVEKNNEDMYYMHDYYFNDWERFKKSFKIILKRKDIPVIRQDVNMSE